MNFLIKIEIIYQTILNLKMWLTTKIIISHIEIINIKKMHKKIIIWNNNKNKVN
jgi:hypothetical protein